MPSGHLKIHLDLLLGPEQDADTQRWLGGPRWPDLVLDLADSPLGEFRGATETGRYEWLAWDGDTAAGYIGYVVDPALRRRGYGTAMISALMTHPALARVPLFVAGVEPANTGSVRCLLGNGFQPLDPGPDWEGTVYYARLKTSAPTTDQLHLPRP